MVGNTARTQSGVVVDPNPGAVNSEGHHPDDVRMLAMKAAYISAEAAERTKKAVAEATEKMLVELRPVLAELLEESNRAILLANGYDRETAEAQKRANAAGAVAGADPTNAPREWPTQEEQRKAREDAKGRYEERYSGSGTTTQQSTAGPLSKPPATPATPQPRATAESQAEAEARARREQAASHAQQAQQRTQKP